MKKSNKERVYNVLDVSRYVINYCNKNNYWVSNLKLQKILYFVQALFITTKGVECFIEEIEAWDFGPVIPEVYKECRKYGGNNIPPITEYTDISKGVWNAVIKSFNWDSICQNDRKLINQMIDVCNEFSSSELVDITLNQKIWVVANKNICNNIIQKKEIEKYFQGRI